MKLTNAARSRFQPDVTCGAGLLVLGLAGTAASPLGPMDDTRQRRALSGALGAEAQQLELERIAAEIPPAESFTPRQKLMAIVVAGMLIATIVALVVLRISLPGSLAHRAGKL